MSFFTGTLLFLLGLHLFVAVPIGSQDQIHILKESLSHTVAHVLPQLLSVGDIAELLVVEETAIRCLNCVRKRHSYFPEDDGSRSGFLEGVYLEDAGIVPKHRSSIPKQFRK